MARLNESSAPSESIDALKRRFVRQNREIARINSIQSLRIRSLESEISHLLSENVSLREQVISLGQELERLDEARLFRDGVYDVKSKLDAKLAELGGLVADLGVLPHKFGNPCNAKPKSIGPREPEQPNSDMRRRVTNSEYQLRPDDGRLPVILEDKYYPRRTLEPRDVRDLINNEPEAPGSSETNESSIRQLDSKSNNINSGCPDDLDATQMVNILADDDNLPPTLEVRKRKTFSPTATDENGPRSEPCIPYRSKHTPRPGFKRKFDPEEDDRYEAMSASSDDGFEFSRSVQVPQESTKSTVSEHVDYPSNPKQLDTKGGSRGRGSSKRKALGPKSANIRVGRPKKDPARASEHKVQQLPDTEVEVSKRHTERPKSKANREHNNLNVKPECDQNRVQKQATNGEEQPITQETLEIVKPGPSGAESPVPQRQEVPELEPGMPSVPSRPTRRQKATVSYTEPNLRAKMRRPTSEFTDAVAGDRIRRDSSSQAASSSNLIAKNKDVEPLSQGFLDSSFGDTVSQGKRRTLPANKSDSLNQQAFITEGQLDNVAHHLRKANSDKVISTVDLNDRETRAGSSMQSNGLPGKGSFLESTTIPGSKLSQQETSGHELGQDSFNDELATLQSDVEPQLLPTDTKVKRGQRVTARRRRSMML